VLPELKRSYPEWKEVFRLTENILKNPVKANILPHIFVEKVAPFVRWAIDHVRGLEIG
jgi:hypothetical protein